MKKILVVLLVLAVAGGVFAQQGEWSLNGKVQFGTRVDFDPSSDTPSGDDPIAVTGLVYDSWDSIKGNLGIGYTRGAFSGSIGLNMNPGGIQGTQFGFDAGIAFNGENFKAAATYDPTFAGTWGGGAVNYASGLLGISRLWGEYGFLNGLLVLEAAYASADTHYWVSDKTGTFKSNKYNTGWKGDEGVFGTDNTFAKYDHADYVRIGVALDSIDFGIVVPGLFTGKGGWGVLTPVDPDNGPYDRKFVQAVKWTLAGVKVDIHPFALAAQFRFADYGIYFGGTFGIGPITAGLSFMGILDGDNIGYENGTIDPKHIKFGGSVDYAGGFFGAGLKAFYDREENNTNTDNFLSAIGVEPTFFINALPNNLRFQVDLGLYFLTDTVNSNTKNKATIWAVQPQVIWNFLGTGASDFGGVQTGIAARYRMAAADTGKLTFVGNNAPSGKYSANFLDLLFKWGF